MHLFRVLCRQRAISDDHLPSGTKLGGQITFSSAAFERRRLISSTSA